MHRLNKKGYPCPPYLYTMSSAGKKSAATAASSTISYLKLTIPSGGATPTPPIGPALGQRGIKAIDFCRQFNETSSKLYLPQTPLRCSIRVNPDRTFAITVRPPASAWLLKKAAGIDKANSGREVAKLPVQYAYEIAKIKAKDPLLQHVPLKRIFEMIVASAKSFGISLT
jgi:large subunit ribosomal protein L11